MENLANLQTLLLHSNQIPEGITSMIRNSVEKAVEYCQKKKIEAKREAKIEAKIEAKREAKRAEQDRLESERVGRERIEKLKKIVSVSEEIKLEMMRKTLKMDEDEFLDNIYDWASEFNFKIKGDLLIINQDTVEDFINALDNQFSEWERSEKTGSGKI